MWELFCQSTSYLQHELLHHHFGVIGHLFSGAIPSNRCQFQSIQL